MRRFLAAVPLFLLVCCVAPEPMPGPKPQIESPPPPPPPPPSADWRDMPLTPGRWTYRAEATGSAASFGVAPAASFTIACEAATRTITLARRSAAMAGDVGAIAFTTSTGSKRYPGAMNATRDMLTARTPAADPFLDQIAFSRGRFLAGIAGQESLVVPAWPEFARVVEDCRR